MIFSSQPVIALASAPVAPTDHCRRTEAESAPSQPRLAVRLEHQRLDGPHVVQRLDQMRLLFGLRGVEQREAAAEHREQRRDAPRDGEGEPEHDRGQQRRIQHEQA